MSKRLYALKVALYVLQQLNVSSADKGDEVLDLLKDAIREEEGRP